MNAPPPPGEELAEWKGGINAFREDAGKHFERVDAKVDKIDDRQDKFDRDLAAMKVKVAAGAAIGSIIGGAIVTFIFAIASKAVGGG